ncbi:CDP-glucose 4,6-dehydratase [uncultured Selenomonas sp.]|uniref:CDP-glucose 4,6-dehydratase n=1 Tax=uncultured Selenomonas sp. TaxID=159275 RepID=UPI0025F05534|nr:CDP-glucose 4,6-dehydratase [uncultured Selenomonas sp.]
MTLEELSSFYRGKRVFVTGHTGFKGMWLAKVLEMAGAEVTGYALEAPTLEGKAALLASKVLEGLHHVPGDVRDFAALQRALIEARPEVVLHLAAQPIVRLSYQHPVETYETNVMGTLHLLECVRTSETMRSLVNVTTDKVYENHEWCWGYRESEPLDGYDPYSNSKSCSELVTHSYEKSFLQAKGVAVSTARAGNVIGGGDFAPDRIVPDAVRAVRAGEPVQVRNPRSTRPYQHVLEPVTTYLFLAMRQYEDRALAGAWNVGPEDADCVTTGALMDLFCTAWGDGARWEHPEQKGEAPHEAAFLKLDCSKLKTQLGWRPRWHIREAMAATVAWYRAWEQKEDIEALMEEQIRAFLNA